MLPGDLGIDVANPEIPNVRADCLSSGSNGGTNNGIIDVNESKCVPEVLLQSGLVKVEHDDDGWPVFKSNYGLVTVVATSQSHITTGFLPSITHVVEFQNLPCDVAQEIDRKIDNDDLTSGKAIGAVCLAGSIFPYYAVAL